MARGLRSSKEKGNRTKLRAKVFAPVETDRAERIHEKMLATLEQAKPEPPKPTYKGNDPSVARVGQEDDSLPKDMEIDGQTGLPHKSLKKRNEDKQRKKRNLKPRNAMKFPTTRGKGALKPYSDSKVRKTRANNP